MVYTWHTAHQALSEVLYIEQESGKLVSRLNKSEIKQYHDIVKAIGHNAVLRELVSDYIKDNKAILSLLAENYRLLVELKRELIKEEMKSREIIEVSQKDVHTIAPLLKGFDLEFKQYSKAAKSVEVQDRLAKHSLKESVIRGRDVADLLLAQVKKLHDALKGKESEHDDWIENQFRAFVKAVSTIHKYEIWYIEFVQSLINLSEKKIEELKGAR